MRHVCRAAPGRVQDFLVGRGKPRKLADDRAPGAAVQPRPSKGGDARGQVDRVGDRQHRDAGVDGVGDRAAAVSSRSKSGRVRARRHLCRMIRIAGPRFRCSAGAQVTSLPQRFLLRRTRGLERILPGAARKLVGDHPADRRLTSGPMCVSLHTWTARRSSSGRLVTAGAVSAQRDGWRRVRASGSHRHYAHPTKPGVVTVPHPRKDIRVGTLRNIFRQAGWDWRER